MEKLKISKNGRYFVKEDGSTFLWVADTAWTVPARLKWDDVRYYLETRKHQGFTVLQMVVLDPEFNEGMKNPSGIPALQDGKLGNRNEEYFSYVDWVLDQAEKAGFYVLLLPVWGQLVTGDSWGGETFTKTVTRENAYEYAEWLGKREKSRKNILWCLGGDRMPIHKGTDYREVWRRIAEGMAKGLTGEELRYNENPEKWKKLLITYHACHEAETGKCSTFSYWGDEEAWISFIMLQSGHGSYAKNYELIQEEYTRKKRILPVWDGEPAYEMMPSEWPIKQDTKFHGTDIVRKRAYWGLFAGAFGHTYGHASVWCTISEKECIMPNQKTWAEAIKSEGSCQMKILRDFLNVFPTAEFSPCQEVLLEQSAGRDCLDSHEQACWHENRNVLLLYFTGSMRERVDVSRMNSGNSVYATVFNPRNGQASNALRMAVTNGIIEVNENMDEMKAETEKREKENPDKREKAKADTEDWILIIKGEEEKVEIPVCVYGVQAQSMEQKKVFDW